MGGRGGAGNRAVGPTAVVQVAASPQVSSAPSVASTGNARTDVRNAVTRLGGSDGWVSMADLRAALPGLSRSDLDSTLRGMGTGERPSLNLEEATNQKSLTQRDRDAAMRLGGRSVDVVQLA